MISLTLNPTLLSVLLLVKKHVALSVQRRELGLTDDWYKEVRTMYNDLPAHLSTDLGLKKNEFCFRGILDFDIPNEWIETESDKLNQFVFSYQGVIA